MTTDPRDLVRRFAGEVIGGGDLAALDELFAPEAAARMRRWVEPFLASFSDVRMEVVTVLVDGDRVVGRFRCSGTHTGPWLGHAPTGRRFRRIDEVYFFRVDDGRIVEAWGLEDTLRRMRQLGLLP
ncbi:ester cyclase [Blastococcus sp. SYSU D00669]